MRSHKRTNLCRARIFGLAAAVWLAVLLAAPAASAQLVPAPSLSATTDWCNTTLTWTQDEPGGGMRLHSFQYRTSNNSGTSWSVWKDISGGGTVRSTTVTHHVSGQITFQVRAYADRPGYIAPSPPSNSVTVPMVAISHTYCQRRIR